MLKNQNTLVGNFNQVLQKSKVFTNSYLIKQLPKATVFINEKLEVMHASDKWVEDFDFTDRNVIGKTLNQLFKVVNNDWILSIQGCLKGKSTGVAIEKFEKDNIEKWFEWTNIPWYDENENVIGVIIQSEDITARILHQKEIDKREDILNKKSEISKIGTWEYDALTDTLYWCETMKALHGVSQDYIPKGETAPLFYLEGKHRDTVISTIEKAIETKTPWSIKSKILTAKGDKKWVIASGQPIIKNNEYIGLVGTFQDIDEQERKNLETKKSEQLLKTLFDNLPLNLFVKDKQSRKVLVNKGECDYFGVKSPSELIGKDNFELLDKETALESQADDERVMKSLKPILGKEVTRIYPNGSMSTLLVSKIPLFDDNGDVNGLVGFSIDISNLKQQQQELQNLINVTSLQNKKLINFAHIVSHNLRSHTANFAMLLDFLVKEEDEDERNSIIKMLTVASDNLLETLDNLNEVVAISTNINIEKKPIRLNSKIVAVEQNLMAFLKKNNATLINEVADNCYVKAIPAYLESILMNFITNGVKYKSPDRDPTIKLSTYKNGNYTVLSIMDNGIGIDLEKYGDKLFGMYKTFHHNEDARGIGLYITKNQVEAMNGKIMTCSEVGKGTTFNIYFNEEN